MRLSDREDFKCVERNPKGAWYIVDTDTNQEDKLESCLESASEKRDISSVNLPRYRTEHQ